MGVEGAACGTCSGNSKDLLLPGDVRDGDVLTRRNVNFLWGGEDPGIAGLVAGVATADVGAGAAGNRSSLM